MGIATTIVLVLNVLTIAAGIWMALTVRDRLRGWVLAAISEEIRKQDDRIQKRLQRMEGQPLDVLPTDKDNPSFSLDYRPGQSMRRGRDGS